MMREDVRDEELGALLYEATETVAQRSREDGFSGTDLRAARAGGAESIQPDRRFRIRTRIAGAAALAAGLAVAFVVPSLARHRLDRRLLGYAAEHLSRSLVRESSSFLAEVPAPSELEAAAAAWAGSLFPTDAGL